MKTGGFVYIAGPYRSLEEGPHDYTEYFGIDSNINEARRWAAKFARAGIPFFCPHLNCVDDKTEALTTEGFRSMDNLQEGATLFGLDVESRHLVPTRLTAINRFGAAEVTLFQNRSWSQALTDGHRVLVGRPGHPIHTRRANTLGDREYLITAAPLQAPSRRGPCIQAAELIGWLLTDGTRVRSTHRITGYRIIQVKQRGRDRITSLLRTLRWRYALHGARQDFYLPAKAARSIHRMLNTDDAKNPPWQVLTQWGQQQLQALWKGMVGGDGHITGASINFAGRGDMGEFFQALSVCLGKPTARTPASVITRSEVAPRTFRSQQFRRGLTAIAPRVWCPTTDVGTWVARREGHTFITGNSAHFEVITPDVPADFWLEMDLALLLKARALFLLPDWGLSAGAKAEYQFSLEHHIPAFNSNAFDLLIKWWEEEPEYAD